MLNNGSPGKGGRKNLIDEETKKRTGGGMQAWLTVKWGGRLWKREEERATLVGIETSSDISKNNRDGNLSEEDKTKRDPFSRGDGR